MYLVNIYSFSQQNQVNYQIDEISHLAMHIFQAAMLNFSINIYFLIEPKSKIYEYFETIF